MTFFAGVIVTIVFIVAAAALAYGTIKITVASTMDALADKPDDKALEIVRKWRAKR